VGTNQRTDRETDTTNRWRVHWRRPRCLDNQEAPAVHGRFAWLFIAVTRSAVTSADRVRWDARTRNRKSINLRHLNCFRCCKAESQIIIIVGGLIVSSTAVVVTVAVRVNVVYFDVYRPKDSSLGMRVCRYNWHSAGSLGWPFPVLKYQNIFSNKIYGSNFIKQHSETVMAWNYQKLTAL